jgi:hypothetical protein
MWRGAETMANQPYTCTIADRLTETDLAWFLADAKRSASDIEAEIAAMHALLLDLPGHITNLEKNDDQF